MTADEPVQGPLFPEWIRDSLEQMQIRAELALDRLRLWAERAEAQWRADGCPDVIHIPVIRSDP